MTNLQKKRKEAGLSQSQLAGKSGLKIQTLQRYEIGIRDFHQAKLGTMLDVALALECNIIDLLDDEELIQKIKKMRQY